MAERYCRDLAGLGFPAVVPSDAIPPNDVLGAIAWLVLGLWDERLVDVWLRENARDYVSVEDPTLEESIIALEIYLRKLERS